MAMNPIVQTIITEVEQAVIGVITQILGKITAGEAKAEDLKAALEEHAAKHGR